MPLDQIFLDTSFIVALINERDQYHEQALGLADRYYSQLLIITDVILLEIANALARGYKREAVQVIEDLTSSNDVEWFAYHLNYLIKRSRYTKHVKTKHGD